jgi:electron transfer flavoprotein beta subunit
MKILACLKAVPDPASRLFVSDDKTWIKDRDLTFVTSEADTHAIEEALRLRDALTGTDPAESPGEGGDTVEVVVLSLGDERAGRALRAGLAMGADRAIHLADDAFLGGDELANARLIAAAIQSDGGADIVLTGVQSDDLGSGMTGIMIAEFLGCVHASVVVAVEPRDGGLRVRRELEGGVTETLDLQMPCLLTIQLGLNQPRYASLKGIMAAKKKELRVWGLEDLPGVDASRLGREGAGYQVREVAAPDRDSHVQILSGSPAEAVAQLVEKLRKDAKVI